MRRFPQPLSRARAVQALLLSSLSPRYPGGFTIASTHAAAATNERNPSGRIRRLLPNPLSSGSRKASIERGRCGARAGAFRQSKASQGNSANGTMQALALRANLTFRQSREITNGLHLLQVQSATGESIDATHCAGCAQIRTSSR